MGVLILYWWCFTCDARGSGPQDEVQRESDKHVRDTTHATMTGTRNATLPRAVK